AGLFVGVVAVVVALVVTAIFAIVGAIVNLIGSLINAISSLFSGGGGVHGISLRFSTDEGLSFSEKVTMERSSEPPALAASPTQLFVAWTGDDDQLNVQS